jgi:hypothetical protein
LRKKLFVVDVHSNFKTKTDVIVSWGFPFHDNSPINVKNVIFDIYNAATVPVINYFYFYINIMNL